jgi:hypothetical protein
MKPEMITLKVGEATIKLPASTIAGLALASVIAQISPQPAQPAMNAAFAAPAVGEIWPGQGGINGGFVAERGSVPAHYLIFATKDVGCHEWGGRGIEVEGLSKTDGLANTEILIGNESEAKYPAANACAEYQADDHHDFYLPAAAELYLGWLNCPEVFAKDAYYWSSSQRSAYFAFYVYFGDGIQLITGKGLELRVRPVRSVLID